MTENTNNEEIEAEMLALDSIYGNKLIYDIQTSTVAITIYPATAENTSSQYVCLPITFSLPKDYPNTPPEIKFSSSRGLSDIVLQSLSKKMEELAIDRCGECILFDLIDMAKDNLTTNNIPSCPCSICLSGFQEGDDFLKTDCYHYFHCYCINEYNSYLQKTQDNKKKNENNTSTFPCPVCRKMVTVDTKLLKESRPPLNDTESEPDLTVIRKQNSKFVKIYERQLKNGGLIDLEYEQKKHLLSTMQQEYESKIATSNTPENSQPKSCTDEQKSTDKISSKSNCNSCDNSRRTDVTRSNYKPNPRKHFNKNQYCSKFAERVPETQGAASNTPKSSQSESSANHENNTDVTSSKSNSNSCETSRKTNATRNNYKPIQKKHFNENPNRSKFVNRAPEKQGFGVHSLVKNNRTHQNKKFYQGYRPEPRYIPRYNRGPESSRCEKNEEESNQSEQRNYSDMKKTNQFDNGHQSFQGQSRNYYRRPHSQPNQFQNRSDNRQHNDSNRYWYSHKRQPKPGSAPGLTLTLTANKQDTK